MPFFHLIAFDHSDNDEKFREDLLNIARTTLSSKLLTVDKEHFSQLAVDAVLRLKGSNHLDYIKVMKKPGGSLKESFLSEGFIIDCKIAMGCQKRLENAK